MPSQIVSRYQALVCSLTYNATGNIDQSQDLAQETFLTAWKQLVTLREPEKLRSWLCAIARNIINNSLRRQKREPSHAAETIDQIARAHSPEPLPVENTITKEEQAILWRSLEKIPDTYREPLVLFYRENQSVEAVAEKLELTPEAVHQRLSRGRKLLSEEVTNFVESALKRTNPGQAFTFGVMAAIPAMTLSAKAASLGAATSKVSAGAKVAALFAVVGAFLAPLFPFFAMWADYNFRRKSGQAPADLRILRTTYIAIAVAIAAVISVVMIMASQGVGFLNAYPGLFAAVMLFGTCALLLVIYLFSRRLGSVLKKIAAANSQAQTMPQSVKPLYEYRSRFQILGLPFIHIRFGGAIGRRLAPDQAALNRPVKAWIAISDTVSIGGLFAWGMTGIAPISFGGGFAFGVLTLAPVSFGVMAVGGFGFGIWALAPFAFGWQACGDSATAWHLAVGGRYAIAHYYALAKNAHALQANTDFVRNIAYHNPFTRFCIAHVTYPVGVFLVWAGMIPSMITTMVQFSRLRKAQRQVVADLNIRQGRNTD